MIWIQIWGLPLKYHYLNFAKYIGAMIGPADWVDWPNGFPRKLRFIRMRVRINQQDPLLVLVYGYKSDMNIYLEFAFHAFK